MLWSLYPLNVAEETKNRLRSLICRLNQTIISPALAKSLGLADERQELYGNLVEIKSLLMTSLKRNLKRAQEHREMHPAPRKGFPPDVELESLEVPHLTYWQRRTWIGIYQREKRTHS
jgi:hypothetical protein